jgi:hypothetical protein
MAFDLLCLYDDMIKGGHLKSINRHKCLIYYRVHNQPSSQLFGLSSALPLG